MKLRFQNNFLGYLQFYYSVIGYRMFIAIFLSIMVSLIDGLGLTMFIPLLQAVEGGATSSKDSMGQLHTFTLLIENLGFSLNLNTVLSVIVLMFTLKGLGRFVEQNYQVKIIHYFMKKIRYELVTNLQSLSYNGYLEQDAGTIQNSFITEVQRMSQAVKGYIRASQALLMLATYVMLAIMANHEFAILVSVAAILSNLLYTKIYTTVKKLSNEVSKKGNDFNAFMIEAIHNYKYLKATNYITRFAKKLKQVIDNTEALNKKSGFYTAITLGIKEPLVVLIVASVIFVQVNWMGGTISAIILSLLLFYRGLNFLIIAQNEWQIFIQNIGAMRSVTDISEAMTQMVEVQGDMPFLKLNKSIELKEIEFNYGDSKILKNLSISIPKNNTIALVGGSGSGKTTLANIICGLISPKHGLILIDGQPLNKYNLTSYRSKIGYISQESAIFNDTLFNNITFWADKTENNLKKFWEVVQLASLSEFIKLQPDNENTKLGDNGILISGGQKQRISIARELFKNPEILILDEATSALDSETEAVIQDNIEKLQGNFTMIIIAHRLSTIRSADKIYLLDKGEVANSGQFESLVNSSETFKRMVALQGLDLKLN